MPIQRPPLIKLGGEENFPSYKSEFDGLYRSHPFIVDVMGYRVMANEDRARHTCFVEKEKGTIGTPLREIWKQERAERIGWIRLALTQPDEVRPATENPDWFAYKLVVYGDSGLGIPTEVFGVVTRPIGEGKVQFLSGYPLDTDTIQRWRNAGWPIYPHKERKGKR